MNYLVHAVKTPTSLWVGRLTKCANPTSQWHFGSIVLVFFFVVWIVVTVSVRGTVQVILSYFVWYITPSRTRYGIYMDLYHFIIFHKGYI